MGSTDKLKRICSEKDIPAVLGETAIVKLLGLSRTTAYYLLQSEAFPTQGYATGTMKKIKQTAVRIMQVAVESDLIVKNPFSGIKVPYVEPEPRRALTEEEVSLIAENWRGARMGLAAMIMLGKGIPRKRSIFGGLASPARFERAAFRLGAHGSIDKKA
jgi:hypothetical protein